MALTDEDGDVDTAWDYDAFGAVRDTSGVQPNDFTFAGEQVDATTDLQYLRARYYDPAVGRFMSRDPFAGISNMPASQNRYQYVLANPVNFVDPSGLCVFGAPCPKPVKKAGDVISGIAEGAVDCVTSVGCSGDIARGLDAFAVTISGIRAGIANTLTVAGCVSTGPVGCLFGKGVGEIVAAPLGLASNIASVASTAASCTGHFLDDSKEGGFSAANVENCLTSVVITIVGFVPESNVDFVAAGLQYCRHEESSC